jgi:hypothetical protein
VVVESIIIVLGVGVFQGRFVRMAAWPMAGAWVYYCAVDSISCRLRLTMVQGCLWNRLIFENCCMQTEQLVGTELPA